MKTIYLMGAIALSLSACGNNEKSNLTGLWERPYKDGQNVYAMISNADQDNNVFACFNLLEKGIPEKCDVHNGTSLQVISPRKACGSNALGTACIEYHSETKTITLFGKGAPFTKVQE